MTRTVRIIAEGSHATGAGHQVRMGVLARALLARGHAVELWTRALPGSSHSWAWQGMNSTIHSESLPLAEMVITAAEQCDCLVIDHYRVDAVQLAVLKKNTIAVMIDDVPGRDLTGAHLVINQNLGVDAEEYSIPALVGPEFALVRPPFVSIGRQPGNQLLVMIGATDVSALNADIAGLLQKRFPACTIHIVSADYRAVSAGLPYVVHERVDGETLAGLMSHSRAAILAASSTVYEALAVGVPFIAIETVDNQRRMAEGLRRRALAPVLGSSDWRTAADLIDTLPRSLVNRVVDGHGAERIAAKMETL
jgi:spore coat polysaccharide biosynthesis predicted glycosyltransferase SpsG